MLDAAICSRIRAGEGVQASVESLRELKAVLSCARSPVGDVVVDTQQQNLLYAGGADVNLTEPARIGSTLVISSSALDTELAGTASGCSTKDSTHSDADPAGAWPKAAPRRQDEEGGAR